MSNTQIIVSVEDIDPVKIAPATETVDIGQWYWVLKEEKDPRDYDWLGCVTKIGSNFVELREPASEHGGQKYIRVLFVDFPTALRFEPNAQRVISEQIQHYQSIAHGKLQEIKAITARLGINPDKRLQSTSSGRELAVLSGQNDVSHYKLALTKASKEDLPALFEAVQKANAKVAKWMGAEMLPLLAQAGGLDGLIENIQDRIFNVSLYAGLTEEVVQITDGAAAAYADKLHIMQRMAFMDEECLANYKTGGMTFKDIKEFDAWLAVQENLERILPFPRCMVAMRVRRDKKERDGDGTLNTAYLNFSLTELDKTTLLYMRNGAQLYRMNCDFVFEELIFPDKTMLNLNEPMMIKMFGNRVDKMISLAEFEVRKAEFQEKKRMSALWKKEQPKSEHWRNPYDNFHFAPSDWAPFDDSNVHFDEASKTISDRINYYNRIALIVQGLFDRSPVFHPHLPVKSWLPDSFAAAVELVYDGSNLLHYGEAPDFEAYHRQCNASMGAGSVVTGQEIFWERKEAEKECDRIERNQHRHRSDYRPKRYRPYGNEGPGFVAQVAKWQAKAGNAVFSWKRDRQGRDSFVGEVLNTTLTVPGSELFNISAYQPGDFRQFFKDPRTRAKYVKWAPFLIAAEEYHAGNLSAQKPLERR